MSLKKRLEEKGATPGKLALIGVLTLILVVVIVKQIPKSAPTVVAGSPVTPVAKLEAEIVQATRTTTVEKNVLPPWPEINLTETLVSNPFKVPDWASQATLSLGSNIDGQNDLAELQKQGASIVMITNNQKSATIGERKLYVGDVVEGYRITDITAKGILLDRVAPF